MVKKDATNDTNFLGVGESRNLPHSDQRLSLAVGHQWRCPAPRAWQNDSRTPHTFPLNGFTNTTPNWNLQVLANNVNILGDLTSADGWDHAVAGRRRLLLMWRLAGPFDQCRFAGRPILEADGYAR